MNELLKKDMTIRILAVVFAVLLWLYANPIEKQTFTVQLNVLNENTLAERGMMLKNRNFPTETVVTVRGRADRIANLRNIDFYAALDFSKVKSVDDEEIEIDGPNYRGKEEGITIIDVKNKRIKIDLEPENEIPIKVDVVTNGKVAENYKVVSVVTVPEVVQIKGMESIVSQVETVKATVDVKGLDRDRIFKPVCRLYRKDGKEETRLERPTIEVRVEVAKEVPVIPVVKGTPARDHVYYDNLKKVKPDRVLVTGTPEQLAKLTELYTESVDIENLNKSSDITAVLKLPDGIKLYETPKEVLVNVTIEQLSEKIFTLDRANIGINNMELDNSLQYAIVQEKLEITLKGNRQVLDRINVPALKPNIDVKGLAAGNHTVPLSISLPNGVRAIQAYTVDITIESK